MRDDYVFRDVTVEDIPAWWELRLRALREHPEAFGSDYEISRQQGPSYSERGYFDGGTNKMFVAFTTIGEVVAQAAVFAESGKRSHIGNLISVYTHPDHRGHGLATQLVQSAIAHLRSFPAIASIRISVTASNIAAIHLYEKVGFTTWGEEPDAIRTADGSCHNERHMVLIGSTHRS